MTLLSDDALRALAAGGTVLSYVALCAGTWRVHRAREARVARAAAALAPAAAGVRPVLVAHASQTGNAEQIAWQTAQALHTAGVPARIASLSQLQADELAATERALFIVSTYGEGDPPDAAAPFVRRVMAGEARPALDNLHCAVLALGDREYQHYCGFGRTLDAWLSRQGAQAMFERIDVDGGDAAALQQWQHQVARVAGTSDLPDWQLAEPFEPWRLARRHLLNPGSAGGPCFHLELEAPAGAARRPDWQAGDLVQVLPPGDGERPREYSIASLPADGRVHLLVRQERHADGTPGLASGWLTEQAAVGDAIALRLRAHGNFRLGDNAVRPLILIGNGTGLAGLRAHLKARAAAGHGANWLVFGERHAAHDAYYRDEITAWQAGGVLERTDLVFSRDQPGKRYVQDRLREQAEVLRDWVARGAAVYVCGSLVGMAAGVEAALVDVLGRDAVDRLIETGRLRRDVY
ncbi:sulfite reductase subunit alpha [Methylibium petroleiphilum]|uniref:sulfite reductase subunit alpha n=1 Tax=Methylibium petroleiphilum TaxID=105560 RepID=UPI003D2806E3